jgi:hypothetical protein
MHNPIFKHTILILYIDFLFKNILNNLSNLNNVNDGDFLHCLNIHTSKFYAAKKALVALLQNS